MRRLLIATFSFVLAVACSSKSGTAEKAGIAGSVAPALEVEESATEEGKPFKPAGPSYAMGTSQQEATDLGRPGKGIPVLPTPGEYALVPGDARLYAAPRSTAHRFFRGRHRLASAFPAKVIKTDLNWTELELVTSPKTDETRAITRCYALPDGMDELRLRVFAKTETLLYTVAERVMQTYADGTRVGLAPGVAMQQARAKLGTYHAGNAEALVTVTLAAGIVRRSFAPTASSPAWPSSAPPAGSKALEPRLITPPTDGVTDGAKPARFRHSESDGFEGYPTRMWSRPNRVLIELEQPCITVSALVDGKKLTDNQLRYGEGFPSDRGPRIPKNTVVFWRDGTRAGVTTGAVDLREGAKLVGSRRCGQVYFDWDAGAGAVTAADDGKPMILCIDAN